MSHRCKSVPGILLLGCFLTVIAMQLPARADDSSPIGKVVALRGKVSALSKDLQTRPLRLKSPIFLSDTIHTENGRVQLMFKDNTLVSLGRNSQMEIKEYLWKPNSETSTMKTYIKEGSFRFMGGAITKDAPRNFITQTPSATIGIRGSMYAGLCRKGSLSVVFEGGKGIFVANSRGRVNIGTPGFGTHANDGDQPPRPPKKFDKGELEEIDSALAVSDSMEEPNTAQAETGQETGTTENTPDSTGEEPEEITDVADSFGSSETSGDGSTDGTVDSGTNTAVDGVSDVVSEVVSSVIASSNETVVSGTTEGKILTLLNDLGYSGPESTSVPGSGITLFKGNVTDPGDSGEHPDDTVIIAAANWHNERIFVFGEDADDKGMITNGFGFGNINADGSISNIVVMGTDGHDDRIETMSMTGTYGNFFGNHSDGPDAVGMAMEGYQYDVQNQTRRTPTNGHLAAVKKSTSSHGTGSETWSGFFAGVAEDMSDPNTDRRIYMNASRETTNAAQDLILNIDKSNGRISGSLNGEDVINLVNDLDAVSIGSNTNNQSSVYISDKYGAAELTSSDGIHEGGSTGGLKEHGNYLVISPEAALESSNSTRWGYWELAYKGPSTNRDYHLHVPGSLWIAGVRDTTTVTTGFTGTYTGKAKGVRFSNTSNMGQLAEGTTLLTIDFDADSVTGNIDFTSTWGTKFQVGGSSSVSSTGFTAKITGIESGPSVTTSSHINGAFYGTSARAVGGNFSAQEAGNSTRYHGIFAGNR